MVVIYNHLEASVFITYFSRFDNKLNGKLAIQPRREYSLFRTLKQHFAYSGVKHSDVVPG